MGDRGTRATVDGAVEPGRDAEVEAVSLGGFPPREHLSRDLGLVFRFLSLTEAETTLAVGEHVVDQLGVLRPEVLVTVLDEAAASASVFAALPDWMTTLDLSVTLLPVPAGDSMRVRTRVLRAGKRIIVLAADAHSGGRRVGAASIGLARVPQSGAATGAALDAPDPAEAFDLRVDSSGFTTPFAETVGIRRSAVYGYEHELDFRGYVANTASTLHGGLSAGLAAYSAESCCRGERVRDAHFRFLSPGTDGPFRTRVTRVGGDANATSWSVHTVDGGDDNRLLVSSSVTTVRPR
jgi:acyl-coenzyme A thioesterase PaaI-like protein